MQKHYIQIACPNCASVLNIRDEYRGRTGSCKHCSHSFTVPEVFTVTPLPSCGNVETSMNFGKAEGSTSRLKPTRRRKLMWSLLTIPILAISGYVVYSLYLPPKEKRVFLSKVDPYYYYELTPRALSLGLNEKSETYTESSAIQSGYIAVPKELENTNALDERNARVAREAEELMAENIRLNEARAQQIVLMEEAELSRLLDLGREIFVTAIRANLEQSTNATFDNWQILKLDNNTYRIDVQVDLNGDGAHVQDYSMTSLLLENDRFLVVEVEISDAYQTRKVHMNISDWSEQEKKTYIRKY